jgi:hypothetical protein
MSAISVAARSTRKCLGNCLENCLGKCPEWPACNGAVRAYPVLWRIIALSENLAGDIVDPRQ